MLATQCVGDVSLEAFLCDVSGRWFGCGIGTGSNQSRWACRRRWKSARSASGPRWASFSGLITDRTVWTSPSAISRLNTLINWPAASRNTAPGRPFHLGGLHRDAEPADLLGQCQQHPGDILGTRDRPRPGRSRSAVADHHHHIGGQAWRPQRRDHCPSSPPGRDRPAPGGRPREVSNRGRSSKIRRRPSCDPGALDDHELRPFRVLARRERAAGRDHPSPALVIRLSSGLHLGAHFTIGLEPVPKTIAPAGPSGLPVQISFSPRHSRSL